MRAGIRTKLLGSFAIVLASLALVGALGLYQLGLATRALHDVADDEAAGLSVAYELSAGSLAMQRDLRAMVLAFTPDEKKKITDSMSATEAAFNSKLATLDSLLTDAEERQTFDI